MPERDDLGRFVPGESGNPSGRQKGPSLIPHLREALDSPASGYREVAGEAEKMGLDPAAVTVADIFVRRTIKLALDGNTKAFGEVWDRVEGRVKEALAIEHAGGVDIDLTQMPTDELKRLEHVLASGADLPEAVAAVRQDADGSDDSGQVGE